MATNLLPSRRQEDWRWSDLSVAEALIDVPAPANDGLPNDIEAKALWLDIDGPRHAFIGGHGGEKVAPAAHATPHPLADLAATRATAGVHLRVEDGEDGGIVQLLHLGVGGSAHDVTRVTLGAGARLVVVENFADSGAADHWLNHRFDAEIGDGATLVRVVRVLNDRGLVTDRVWAEVGANALFRGIILTDGEGTVRLDTYVDCVGEGARAEVNGALLGSGTARSDALVVISHKVPNTTSNQLFRLVGNEKSSLSVASRVGVVRHAQKTVSEQSLRGLVLARTASCDLKPELEIFADDVRCDHGATVGELDRKALFYLQSRGIPYEEAATLLTEAFVADVFHDLPDQLAGVLEEEGRLWLGGQI